MDRDEGSSGVSQPEVMERARRWLEQVLQQMGLEAEVKVLDGVLEIDAAQLSISQKSCLLGFPPVIDTSRSSATEPAAMGITLDALQYLANTLLNLNQPPAQQFSYTIELEGYRQRRQQELQTLALRAVEQVRASGSEYEFKGLSAAERRQMHTFFSTPEYGDLESFSRGREPDRRFVIRPLQASEVPTEEPTAE